MAKKKRVMTAAQKAGLAKGRATLAKKRAGKRTKKAVKKKAIKKTVKKTVKRSPAQRAARKDKNTKPGYYPNPIKTVYLVGAKSRVGNKKGYFNGSKKLDVKDKAEDFDNFVVAKQVATNLAEQFVQFQFFVETVKKKVNRRPNPESRETAQAVKLYEDFTGHEANTIDTVKIPAYKTGVKVGTVDGILYTTRRDGETQKYVHKFKQHAKPDFAVSHDGRQIYAIGGDFEFTERGIVDN